MSRTFREIAETVITAAVIFVLLQAATQTFKVVGPSMNTPLADGQHLLVNKFVYETVESDVLADLSDLCQQRHAGRQSEDEITVFKNGGGGHLDLMCARILHQHCDQ